MTSLELTNRGHERSRSREGEADIALAGLLEQVRRLQRENFLTRMVRAGQAIVGNALPEAPPNDDAEYSADYRIPTSTVTSH